MRPLDTSEWVTTLIPRRNFSAKFMKNRLNGPESMEIGNYLDLCLSLARTIRKPLSCISVKTIWKALSKYVESSTRKAMRIYFQIVLLSSRKAKSMDMPNKFF